MGEKIIPDRLLGDPEWRSFEEWLHKKSVEGWNEATPNDISAAIEGRLRQDGFCRFLHRVGVLGSAPLMAPIWESNAVFFGNREGSEPYRTPYLKPEDPTADIHPLGDTVIHNLFVAFREQQHIRGDVHSEDFYYWLPKNANEDTAPNLFFSNPLEMKTRHSIRVHYCTVGEILFTLLAWRVLDSGREPSSIALEDKLAVGCETSTTIKAATARSKGKQEEEALDKVFSPKSLADICQDLLLLHRTDRRLTLTAWSVSAARFVEQMGLLKVAAANTEPEQFIYQLLSCIPAFVAAFGDNGMSDLLRHARFPLWPYYFWVATDHSPRCYLVAPIWSSPYYGVKRCAPGVSEEKISTTGLAVAAVAPLTAIDWSLGDSVQCDPAVRATNVPDLLSILRALGEPAIEILYYHQLHTKLLDLRRKEVLSAILARNLSHNVGSHVLANPSLLERVDILSRSMDNESTKLARRRILRTFVGYLQQRLDFIARMVIRSRQPPEPLFFFADVLYPFLRQELLLDTLLDDLDYRGEKLSIMIVQIEDGSSVSIRFDQARRGRLVGRASPKGANVTDDPIPDDLSPVENGESSSFSDFLVGVPGGAVGCHAFYAVLENILRNSAKYGSRLSQLHPPSELVLQLTIRKHGSERILDIHDNLSEETEIDGKQLSSELQRRMIEDPIDFQGRPVGHSHGLHEIRMCCQYLIGETPEFSDKRPVVTLCQYENPEQGRPPRIGYSLRLTEPTLLAVFALSTEEAPE